ncbi:multidrug effflux MFS transporter [Shewanella xiamenensis]|uniref:multidrug effflux MFS transporter n=1 Tax=Shewanella xiamenensis TaxID=332186 RepID=UPI001CC662B0|nr:multidrug effflux MFS transporter [Shewanella xiamenensis]
MTTTTHTPGVGLKLAVSLALITMLGPVAIDMYLAAMPVMATDLQTSYASLQLTLTVFLLAMGGGQLVFGPVVDAWGRRRPLLAGLALYVLAALWVASAQSAEIMLYGRFLQGLSAALILVVAMSTVRDVSSGVAATKLFALLVTIQGVAPILAPAVGGVINEWLGWRAVMVTMAVLGLLAATNSLINLRETLPVEKRSPLHLGAVFRTYWRIVSDRNFLAPALALSAVFFVLFGYIGGAAYVYQVGFGLRSDVFGFVFGGTGIAIMIGAMASSRLARTRHVSQLAVLAVAIMCLGGLLALVAAIAGLGLYGIVPGLFVTMLGLGMAEPPIMSMAMGSQERALGSTSALLGAGTNVLGAAATPLAGLASEIGAWPWLAFLFGSSVVALGLTWWSARRAAGVEFALH